jgi:hypothetical protein
VSLQVWDHTGSNCRGSDSGKDEAQNALGVRVVSHASFCKPVSLQNLLGTSTCLQAWMAVWTVVGTCITW